ncbi:hypothetical protein OsJ_02013 [Oryza sativa Japonica Group]|uniref:F-box domain-containing protein n=1 Tax=Oryza sativa subsp. japonica TaxID=39947 RepID=B9EX84_ORYSJ|nr:hypothetical protein OsJ_02013 [Oryza sativa Japonica Group]
MAAACAWDALPEHLQERILSLLPLTALLPVAAASRALRRLLRSRAFKALLTPHRLDAFFLLSRGPGLQPAFPPLPPRPAGGFPSRRLFPLPPRHRRLAPPPPAPPRHLLPPRRRPPHPGLLLLLLLMLPRGDLPLPFALLGNAAGDRRQLFVLGRGPDAILVFDLATGQWTVLPAAMPLGLTTAHLFVFGGRLFLVGGVERFGVVERVLVWRLEGSEAAAEWTEVGAMPEEVFDELVAGRHGSFWHFQAADRMGIVCLYNAVDGRLVMFDAVDGGWTRLSRVSGLDVEESRRWFGHVVEPRVELLLG